jgi:hypothetical protein
MKFDNGEWYAQLIAHNRMETETTDMNTFQPNLFKPYDLVWVGEENDEVPSGKLHYVGQVLSRETPEHTYMVRRVPGHPGTLVELGAELLLPLPRTSWRLSHVAYAEVSGRGQFPIDMLRYDACQPVNFDLVRDNGLLRTRMREGHEGEALIVAKACRGGHAGWTIARWESFMWDLRETTILPLGEE